MDTSQCPRCERRHGSNTVYQKTMSRVTHDCEYMLSSENHLPHEVYLRLCILPKKRSLFLLFFLLFRGLQFLQDRHTQKNKGAIWNQKWFTGAMSPTNHLWFHKEPLSKSLLKEPCLRLHSCLEEP